MPDSTIPGKPADTSEERVPETAEEMKSLRDIIVGPQKERIDRLEARLDDPSVRTEEISQHLAEALVLRAGRDDQVARALEPTLAEAIKASVQKRPRVLADALFPLMGPGIRKAISATIMGMIQSFNQVLNHSFSWRGLKWRFEALRTRKPFAEVVLLHSLVYQVEQIFLIHNQTGLVLNHVVARAVDIQDPDLVSGMLTAIQDFIQDSFSTGEEAGIDTLRVGNDRSVWVEQGARTTLAAVIRGTPPMDLRRELHDVLYRLELKKSDALEAFGGDTGPFVDLEEDLTACLQFKLKEERTRISPWLWLLLAGLLGLAGWGGLHIYKEHQKWAGFVETLRQTPGIVVTQAQRRGGKIYLSGLKDPQAADPLALLVEAGFDPARTRARWETYYALDPVFVLARIRQALKPPDGVGLDLVDGVLIINGTAPHLWIAHARQLAPLIPGVQAVSTDGLRSAEAHELKTLGRQIEDIFIQFARGTTTLGRDQYPRVERVAELLRKVQALAVRLDRDVRILIVGHTDATGEEDYNRELSYQRAEKVWRILLRMGVGPRHLAVRGMGAAEPLHEESTEENRERNRRVSFRVFPVAD
ncbi:MAG: OmpA family protein [Desulfobacterales bacterium]|nr:OmpA family protein [Desulfobacterales bacterium]